MQVLIIDPDEAVRDFLVMLLESIDINYKIATTSKEAVQILSTETINLTICENELEGKSTKPIYEFIKEKSLPIAFALFTSNKIQDIEDYSDLLKEGEYNFYIKKPYKDAEFLKVVETVEDNIDSISPPGEAPKSDYQKPKDMAGNLTGKVAKENTASSSNLKGHLEQQAREDDKKHSLKDSSKTSGHLSGKNKLDDKKDQKDHSVDSDSHTPGNLSGKNKLDDKKDQKDHSVKSDSHTPGNLSGKNKLENKKDQKDHSVKSDSQTPGNLSGKNKLDDKKDQKDHSVDSDSHTPGNLSGKNKLDDKKDQKDHSVESDSHTPGNLSGKNKLDNKKDQKDHSVESDSQTPGNLSGKNKLDDKKDQKDHSVDSDSQTPGNLRGDNESQSINRLETDYIKNYQPIKINRFYNFEKLPFAVYIKISASKMVKIIHENDPYKISIIKKYQDRSFSLLYIDKIYYKKFLSLFSARLSHKMSMAPKSKKNIIASQVILNDVLREEITEIGINEQLYYKTLQIIDTTTKLLKTNPEVTNSMKSVLFGVNYISEHSIILNLIVAAICEEAGWQNNDMEQKLCLASIFHDIGFKNKPLSKVTRLDNEKITPEMKSEIKEHPEKAADLLRQVQTISNDVLLIISQHHERPDGTGYPKGLNGQNISPMSALFIIAHEYSNYISSDIDSPEYSSSYMFLAHLKNNFNQGNFKKPYASFINRFGDIIKKSEINT